MISSIKNFFDHSESIFWGRLQVAIGAIFAVLSVADLTPFNLPPKYIAAWAIVNGIITEYLRRLNTRVEKTIVMDPQGVVSEIKYIKSDSKVPLDAAVIKTTVQPSEQVESEKPK